MKKIKFIFTAAIVFFSGLNFSSAQTIKIGTIAPKGSVWHNALRDMAEEWKNVSNGKIQVQLYAGGVAGDDLDMVRKMRINQLQGAALTGHGLASIVKEIGIFQLPMLVRSDEELDYTLQRLAPKFNADMEEKGFKLLYWSEIGWVYLFSKTKVTKPADLKTLKMWVWSGDPSWTDAIKNAGYKPVALPPTEIHTGLSSGLIETVSAPPVAALSYQWFGLADNMLSMKWAPLTAAVVISKKTWDKIPRDLQPKILLAAVRAGTKAKEEIRKLESEAIKSMQGYGLKVTKIDTTTTKEWENEIQSVFPQIIGNAIPTDIYKEVVEILKDFRK
ncbi:MAG: TRAP transporter substrate-binding protein DctP [Spirochaetia bacterium]|nr:TRAP transporter substrate-binding protein DctP [Spirochaetia bacterium]